MQFKQKLSRAKIVYFDGICGLCNRVVDFLMIKDHSGIFKYAPLQGITANENLDPSLLKNLDTIIYQEGDRIYLKSDAAIRILAQLGGLWKLTIVLWLVPRIIRDSVYDYIARKRYGWFGKRDICRIILPEERGIILP